MSLLRRCVFRAALVLVGMPLTAGAAAAEPPAADLPQARVRFDGHTLRLAFTAANDDESLMEFVPEGQTLDTWTRLAAIRVYHDRRLGPQRRAGIMLEQVKKAYPESPAVATDDPGSPQSTVAFAIWSPDEPGVEFNVFAFGQSQDGADTALQYALRVAAKPEAFVARDFEPLRKRVVTAFFRHQWHVLHDRDWRAAGIVLAPAEADLCAALRTGDAAALETVLATADALSAAVLFTAADVALEKARLEDAGFLFYAGQLRSRFDERCFPPRHVAGQDPLLAYRSLSLDLGSAINPAVMERPPIFAAALDRVARWHPKAPREYTPGYPCDGRLKEQEAAAAAEPNRAEFLARMGDFAKLLGDPEYLAATRVLRGFSRADADALPTPDERAQALETVTRIEKAHGLDGVFR